MFPQIFGKYVLERELASGGMARVYLATLRGAVGFEKRLVVKQIRPELALDEAFVRRFVEEAKIAVELSHPNIVPVYELGVELGIYYIAMELCEGLTLTEVLMDTGPLDAAEGAYLGIEICRALDYAHRRGGIVHRDVTPRNVLLDEEGAVRLIDFGIAAPVAPGQTRVEVFGSPGHMPPEQIRGEQLTPATDVFAVGALLIEAWTGRPPFRRGSFEASAAALKEPLAPLGTLKPDIAPIAAVIERTVALAAADRPQDAESLARKLREFSRPFDSGDVAKRLGARVRRARRRAHGSDSWLPEGTGAPLTPAASPRALLSSRSPQSLQTPATPPMAQLTPATPPGTPPITRTFAARDDLVEWTRKLNSTPPAAFAADEAASDADVVLRRSSPPPSVLEADDEPATRAMPRSKPPADGKNGENPRFRALIGALVVAAGALAFAALRAGAPAVAPPHAATSIAKPSVLSAPALAPSVVETTRPPSPSPSSQPKPRASVAKPLPSASAAPSADAGAAQLRLTADPQASVTIVGGRITQTRSTPIASLSLPAGSYTVTFRSPTFGDPVATRVDLAAGAFRSVHADFRAAVPTVVVR
ncbi:MAG TPA: serine/threonine-protein kinase [Polyangiaceae bacterium]|nr:serine/threonine-protein kinase [Polyangiaceae bacterium]